MSEAPISPSTQDTRRDVVVEAARSLLERLDAVRADPRYQAVWESAEIHGITYSGLRYEAELGDLRRALDRLDQGAARGD